MSFLRRVLLYILFFLLIISIYKDLSVGSSMTKEVEKTTPKNSVDIAFKAIKVKVQPGDTVLSLMEKVNNYELDNLDIDKIIADFKQLNPLVNPYDLKINHYYYFPVY